MEVRVILEKKVNGNWEVLKVETHEVPPLHEWGEAERDVWEAEVTTRLQEEFSLPSGEGDYDSGVWGGGDYCTYYYTADNGEEWSVTFEYPREFYEEPVE